MINPSPRNGSLQGFDERSGAGGYSDSANVALNVSSSNPLAVKSGQSLISTISRYASGGEKDTPYVKSAEILTVLSSVPPANSFRPAYVAGAVKTPQFTTADLQYNKLLRLATTPSAPSINSVANNFAGPWLDFRPGASSSELHPSDNMPWYGRDIARQVGTAALMLNSDFSNAEKETLLIRMVQLGIDLYGIVQDGGENNWYNNGGHASGRKFPILFAGVMLNDPGMRDIGKNTRVMFGEDDQTFYVAQSNIDITNSGAWNPDTRSSTTPYTSSDLGKPEWGIRHRTNPESDNAAWSAMYRECCTAYSWAGFVLAADLMGLREAWNWDPLFDYMERYMNTATNWRQLDTFSEEMWDRYHGASVQAPAAPPEPPELNIN